MDVTLVLTHRCNLSCHYCYAGRHLHKDMDEDTIERGLDLLYADGAETAQLSFFGGEPYLAKDKLERAVLGARARAEAAGAQLVVQCTTNGTQLSRDDIDFIVASDMRVTVSIDGVREAHEMNRPRAGGRSSFDSAVAGLRALIARGADPEVCMVITPDTVPFVYRSVTWLWDEGVRKVNANLELGGRWDAIDRHELEQELTTVGWDLLARRVRGEQVAFNPFMNGIRSAARALENATFGPPGASTNATADPWSAPGSSCSTGSGPARRLQVVVATTGNLYPCAPMVGQDEDDGPEAALRIGHIDDGLAALAAGLRAESAICRDGRECACAAYLETGDRTLGGPVGVWFGQLSDKLGRAVGAGYFADRHRVANAGLDTDLRPRWQWRSIICGLAAATSGVALLASAMLRGGVTAGDQPDSELRYIDVSRPYVIEEPERDTRKPMPAPIESLPPRVLTAGMIAAPPMPGERGYSQEHFLNSREQFPLWSEELTDVGSFGDTQLTPHHSRRSERAEPDACAARMSLTEAPECAGPLGADDPE